MLAAVLHCEHSVSKLLVEEARQLTVEKALSTILGADRHDLPIISSEGTFLTT